MNENKNIRVVVAMSGGVDSSVAAALLVEQGYDVIGIMMRLWAEESTPGCEHNRCCTPEQMNDARRIADKLSIPFYVLDTKDVFRNTVVEYFITQHSKALTPNPCLECNRHIRFTHLFNHALTLDADYLATGHYARIEETSDGVYLLKKGIDETKDQSYVLSVLQQKHLKHTMFPLGTYPKSEVRELAAKFGLPTASKQDSQDLCFLGDGDYRRFLTDYAPQIMKSGPIALKSGEIIGEHHGLANYTIGQRRGLGVSYKEPLYVVEINPGHNTLIVGTDAELNKSRLTAKNMNWISDNTPIEPFQAEVKIRYKSTPTQALIRPLENRRVAVDFDEPLKDITPGQGAVIYKGDTCLGVGTIERDDIT
jgi:tRNA-uridine 2-sulfurtransferase